MRVELKSFSGAPLFVDPKAVVAVAESSADGCTALYLRDVRDPLTVRGTPAEVHKALEQK
jgi:hypothetical protein